MSPLTPTISLAEAVRMIDALLIYKTGLVFTGGDTGLLRRKTVLAILARVEPAVPVSTLTLDNVHAALAKMPFGLAPWDDPELYAREFVAALIAEAPDGQ